METKKSKNADLEPKRGIYFQIGTIVALMLVFYAFEWKSYNYTESAFAASTWDGTLIEDLPPVTKPELPAPPKQFVNIVAVDNIVDGPDIELFNIEDTPMDSVPAYVYKPIAPVEVIVEPEEPFKVVEDMPEFPGGTSELLRFLATHIQYPQIARETGIQGTVHLQFVVEKDGTASNIKVLRGIGGGCDEEALRVLRSMPVWKAGKQRGIPVRVLFSLPVHFRLQ